MDRSIFNEGIKAIQLVTNRTIKDGQKDFIYKKLNHITNSAFNKILEMYIDEVPCPLNIIGYFRNTYRNVRPAKPMYEDDGKSGWVNGEYTKFQHELFMKAVYRMTIINKRREDFNYTVICGILNKVWVNNTGNGLDEALGAFHKELNQWEGKI